MLALCYRSQHLTQAAWWPELGKGWTFGPGPIYSAVKKVPTNDKEKKECTSFTFLLKKSQNLI